MSEEIRIDGYMNALSGIGKSRDKSQYSTFGRFIRLVDKELADMYVGDGLAKSIVDTICNDATREWIENKTTDEKKDEVYKELERIDARNKFNEALKLNNLFGGSIIIIGTAGSGLLTKPLVPERVRGIDWLRVYDRTRINLSLSKKYTDPNLSNYMNYELFYIEPSSDGQPGYYVHTSRCLQFFGETVPEEASYSDIDTDYWGTSCLQSVFTRVLDFGITNQAIANILQEFTVDKYKISGLKNMLVKGNEQKLINRMEIISMSKSVINGVLMGENEDWGRDSVNLGGLPELLDRLMVIIASYTPFKYPVTKLFGRSPAGMNATGEGDQKNYYDAVKSFQYEKMLKPLYRLLDIISNYIQVDEGYVLEFAPLKQQTEKERIENDKMEMEARNIESQMLQTYITNGVLLPEEVELYLKNKYKLDIETEKNTESFTTEQND